MPVEINGLHPSALKNTAEGTPARVGRDDPSVAKQETGRPASSDTVSLTDTAARLKGLEKTIAALPVVDTHRVEHIKKALANGSYAIDDKKVAEKFNDFEQSLSDKD
jgi:negative regulator of flagellin synthesis FlgM